MIKGTVKFFNSAKGFGFITPDDGGNDIFLPAATIAASGAPRLNAGQRVSFEQEPDVKGPKAVRLALLDEQPRPASQARITAYCDPSADESETVLAALRAEGQEPLLIDYRTAPPARDELKRLSLLLSGAGPSLVRRYHPLFLELRLDDRFLAENEFWTAICEHPALINGPVLVSGNKVRVCKTPEDVRAFLAPGGNGVTEKSKTISPRMLAMLKGDASLPPEAEAAACAPVPDIEDIAPPAAAPKARKTAAAKKAAAPAVAKTKTAAKAAARKPAAKSTAKTPAKKKKA